MTIYKENLNKVIAPLLEYIGAEYAGKTDATMKGSDQASKSLQKICCGRGGVYDAASIAEPPCERIPDVNHKSTVAEGWLPLILREIREFNKNGTEYINSSAEALLKSHGIINWLYEKSQTRKRIFYRGEHKYCRDLIPRIGRKGCKHIQTDPRKVTDCELEHLEKFQKKITVDKELKEDIFRQGDVPAFDDSEWWAIMAHYEEEYGTRMIDLTSSLFCGLFFACVSWSGEINEEIDGTLYLIPEENWRDENIEPIKSYDVKDYFNVDGHDDIPRFREARGRNPRLVAQDGFFIWQPRFDQAIRLGQHYKFRVFRGAKKHILRELYSIGYTAKRIVRGQRGEILHKQICEDLDLTPD